MLSRVSNEQIESRFWKRLTFYWLGDNPGQDLFGQRLRHLPAPRMIGSPKIPCSEACIIESAELVSTKANASWESRKTVNVMRVDSGTRDYDSRPQYLVSGFLVLLVLSQKYHQCSPNLVFLLVTQKYHQTVVHNNVVA
jgi:hypothetical protein